METGISKPKGQSLSKVGYCRKCVIVDDLNENRLCAICQDATDQLNKEKEMLDGNQTR